MHGLPRKQLYVVVCDGPDRNRSLFLGPAGLCQHRTATGCCPCNQNEFGKAMKVSRRPHSFVNQPQPDFVRMILVQRALPAYLFVHEL